MKALEALVRIIYTTPELEVSIEEGTTRRRLEFTINQDIEDYLAKSRVQNIIALNLYPLNERRLVSITYATRDAEVCAAEERALREELSTSINQAMERYLEASRLQDVLEIELFPCGEDCFECSCVEAA